MLELLLMLNLTGLAAAFSAIFGILFRQSQNILLICKFAISCSVLLFFSPKIHCELYFYHMIFYVCLLCIVFGLFVIICSLLRSSF